MPENALEDARFDHVSETGELVFVSGAGKFAVKVDEALERAILEAKQIRTETQEERQQQAPSTLPISQIQSLIRAGANPTRVAERYSLSEALVRRFSAAVETEKQYAIEQFLAVPAPKESRVRTLSELIERTFAAAHVRLEDVRWKATRRGLEPWKITAEFDSAGHAARAEWSWNMHDNAVNCLNATARKLIGEQDTPTEGHAEKQVDQNFLASLNLPGDSARSARIEQTVSAWNAPEPVAPQARISRPPLRLSHRRPFRCRTVRKSRRRSPPPLQRRNLPKTRKTRNPPASSSPISPRRHHPILIVRAPPNRSAVQDAPQCRVGMKFCSVTD